LNDLGRSRLTPRGADRPVWAISHDERAPNAFPVQHVRLTGGGSRRPLGGATDSSLPLQTSPLDTVYICAYTRTLVRPEW
jgi:hypothetical protein